MRSLDEIRGSYNMRKLEEIYEAVSNDDIKQFAVDIATKFDARRMKGSKPYGDSDSIREMIIAKMKKEGWIKGK